MLFSQRTSEVLELPTRSGHEGRPVVGPLLLEDLDQGEVELGDEDPLGLA